SDLPIQDLHADPARVGVDHEDGLRREGAMDEALLVRVTQRLGDLTYEIEPCVDVESGTALRQEVVESLCARMMLENECRTERVLGVAPGRQNPGVLDAAQHLVLAP